MLLIQFRLQQNNVNASFEQDFRLLLIIKHNVSKESLFLNEVTLSYRINATGQDYQYGNIIEKMIPI